jgi:mRNA interferase RelE/StbE
VASYNLLIRPSAAKELAALPKKDRKRITSKLNSLSAEPRPVGCEKLSGQESMYRLRRGSYRIVYWIDDAGQTVGVIRIRHRKDVYR